MKIYDAENQILGRMCTRIAKDLLKGEQVFVVNSEKAVLAGNPKERVRFYKKRIDRGDPLKGPFFPKYPDDILRRTVRGMLPWHQAKGRAAYKKLKVFVGIPEEFKSANKEKLQDADAEKLTTTFITLNDLSISLGAQKRW